MISSSLQAATQIKHVSKEKWQFYLLATFTVEKNLSINIVHLEWNREVLSRVWNGGVGYSTCS
jgi:hypothetical protein